MTRKNEEAPKKVFLVQGKTTVSDYGLTANEALEQFEGVIQQINAVPSEYRDNIWVEKQFEDGGGDYSPELEIAVTYWRYETEDERQTREDGEARMEKLKEINERQLYEELKRKY